MELYRHNPQFDLAEKICQTLAQAGFEAYLAGGCVRDLLLRRTPHDFDVATSAKPEDIEKLFPKTLPIGKQFGVMVVVSEGAQVEVATFRKDGPTKDGRRPESVEYSSAKEDASRRDFTINGLFYDLQKKHYIDFVKGEGDIKARILRAIGNPLARFKEDRLRMLRGVRLSGQLGFTIENETFEAIQNQAVEINSVSGERIQEELTKLLMSDFLAVGLENLLQSNLLVQLLGLPKLSPVLAQSIFPKHKANREDQWFHFFLWIEAMSPQGLEFYEKLAEKWKFSRNLKRQTLGALKWVFGKDHFTSHSLGEIIELSFDPENERGLNEYFKTLESESDKKKHNLYLLQKKNLDGSKPDPWLEAADFDWLQGEALGQALKSCYWEQLEGKCKNKEQLMASWKRREHGR
jgi:tRNA nucleotidyltransferase/poly(A) polymerase